MTFGDVIKTYRKSQGLSMAVFADRCGVSKGYISMLENNKNKKTGKPMIPKVTTLMNIAKVMGISFDELILKVDPDTVITWEKETPIDFSDEEIKHILKYRKLDDPGKEAVNVILDLQYKRIYGIEKKESAG